MYSILLTQGTIRLPYLNKYPGKLYFKQLSSTYVTSHCLLLSDWKDVLIIPCKFAYVVHNSVTTAALPLTYILLSN